MRADGGSNTDPSAEEHPTLEIEAEGVACAVLSYRGVGASTYSSAYVALWAENKDVVKSPLAGIQRIVQATIEVVESGCLKVK